MVTSWYSRTCFLSLELLNWPKTYTHIIGSLAFYGCAQTGTTECSGRGLKQSSLRWHGREEWACSTPQCSKPKNKHSDGRWSLPWESTLGLLTLARTALKQERSALPGSFFVSGPSQHWSGLCLVARCGLLDVPHQNSQWLLWCWSKQTIWSQSMWYLVLFHSLNLIIWSKTSKQANNIQKYTNNTELLHLFSFSEKDFCLLYTSLAKCSWFLHHIHIHFSSTISFMAWFFCFIATAQHPVSTFLLVFQLWSSPIQVIARAKLLSF